MPQKHSDHSGNYPRNKLPPIPERELILFHWSPTSNRDRINRYGLRTHQPSLDGIWRPPYVCFGYDPAFAWHISGRMWPEIKSWDLWCVNVEFQTSFDSWELITDTMYKTGKTFIKEYRVYKRIYKRDVEYLATRSQ